MTDSTPSQTYNDSTHQLLRSPEVQRLLASLRKGLNAALSPDLILIENGRLLQKLVDQLGDRDLVLHLCKEFKDFDSAGVTSPEVVARRRSKNLTSGSGGRL